MLLKFKIFIMKIKILSMGSKDGSGLNIEQLKSVAKN